MKIVYFAPYLPHPLDTGAKFRAHALVEALSTFAEVTLIVLSDPIPEHHLETYPRKKQTHFFPHPNESRAQKIKRYLTGPISPYGTILSKHMPAGRLEAIQKILQDTQPDHVILGNTYHARLIRHLGFPPEKTTIDTHNVESVLMERISKDKTHPLQKLRFKFLAWEARQIEQDLKKASRVLAVSREDAKHYQSMGIKNVTVVPNVVQSQTYQHLKPGDPRRLVYTAWYLFPPNEEAALRIIKLSTKLIEKGVLHQVSLVGREPTQSMHQAAANQDHITITGEVESVLPYLEQANVVFAPIFSGSGTKLKLIEALQANRLVITTPLGAEGLDLTPGEHALVGRTEAELLGLLEDAITHPEKHQAIQQAGQKHALRHFSQQNVTDTIRQLFQQP